MPITPPPISPAEPAVAARLDAALRAEEAAATERNHAIDKYRELRAAVIGLLIFAAACAFWSWHAHH